MSEALTAAGFAAAAITYWYARRILTDLSRSLH